MIKLQNGGVVREVETQREADYYADFGYKVISSDQEENDASENPGDGATEETPEGASGDDKKSGSSGKKGATKEE